MQKTYVGEWQNFLFLNGWTEYRDTGGYQEPRYRRIGNVVYFEGLVKNSNNSPHNNICMVGESFRPKKTIQVPITGQMNESGLGQKTLMLTILNNGVCFLQGVTTYKDMWLSLSGVYYFLD